MLRVLVENGVGTPGLVEKARAKLVDDGFRFVNGGNAASFDFDESAVIIPDGTEKSVARGQRVARVPGPAGQLGDHLGPGPDGRRRDRHPRQGLRTLIRVGELSR